MPLKEPVQQQSPPHRDPGGQRLWPALSRNVLRLLGEPGLDHRVDVRELWSGHYRVNILLAGEYGSAKIVHSYFVAADEDGVILDAMPRIVKRY